MRSGQIELHPDLRRKKTLCLHLGQAQSILAMMPETYRNLRKAKKSALRCAIVAAPDSRYRHIETGPYRVTRNPMYLQMALIYVGSSVLFAGF
jgi:steroid 5-alpha reductase family enzyme